MGRIRCIRLAIAITLITLIAVIPVIRFVMMRGVCIFVAHAILCVEFLTTRLLNCRITDCIVDVVVVVRKTPISRLLGVRYIVRITRLMQARLSKARRQMTMRSRFEEHGCIKILRIQQDMRAVNCIGIPHHHASWAFKIRNFRFNARIQNLCVIQLLRIHAEPAQILILDFWQRPYAASTRTQFLENRWRFICQTSGCKIRNRDNCRVAVVIHALCARIIGKGHTQTSIALIVSCHQIIVPWNKA